MSDPITINVNGAAHRVQAGPDTPLLYVLRNELGLNGPKFGCGLGQCGACTVHMGDMAIRSCVFPVSAVAQPITTLEGLAVNGKPHPLQQAFIDHQAVQCGYCVNGMIMQAAAFLKEKPGADRGEIIAALDNNLCRCGTHLRILDAVEAVSQPKKVSS